MSENGARKRLGDRPGRPVCTTCTGTARSTVAKERSTDWHELLSVSPGRLDRSSEDRVGQLAGRPTDTDLDSFSVLESNSIRVS